MCGIAGYDFADNARLPGGLPQRLIDALRHRGPDGDGAVAFVRTGDGLQPTDPQHAPICLVHTRLSIIDLSDAASQPMSNEDASVWLSFNGEIYNFPELRRELEALGHRFRSHCDAEVVVHGYEAWGDSVVARLRGMFAFALLDLRRDRWLCARDPFGIKPLVYAHRPGRFAFASDLNALRRVPGIDTEIDPDALAQYLALGYVPAPATIAIGAHKLPAGHLAVVEHGELLLHRYSAHPPARRIGTLPDALRETRAVLEESVRAHLLADVPVGSFLSGGIDSGLVVALAHEAGARPRCFTMGFEQAGYDERRPARRLARRLELPWHDDVASAARVHQELLHLATIFDEPFADPSAAPTSLVARLARHHVKAVLSGDGGDELFLGYSRYRLFAVADRARQAPLALRRRAAALGAALPAGLIDSVYQRTRGLAGLPRLRHPARKLQAVAATLASDDRLALYADTLRIASPAVLARMREGAEQVTTLALARAAAQAPPQPAQLWGSHIDESTYLPEDILTKVDRTTMAVGLEARVPLLDVRVRALARAIEPELHLRHGGKAVLRELLGAVIDVPHSRRPKQGFSIPLAEWLRGPLHAEAEACSADARFGALGLSLAGITRLVEEHRRRRQDHAPAIWALICLRRHLDVQGLG